MIDYFELVQQHCPTEIVQHLSTIDLTNVGPNTSVFWPQDFRRGVDFPHDCMAAMVGYVGQQMRPDMSDGVIGSYFYNVWIAGPGISLELKQQVAAFAAIVTIRDDFVLDYFRALRSLGIDVRDAIAPQFLPSPPPLVLNEADRNFQYHLYLAAMGEDGALDWFQDLVDQLIKPDDITMVHDRLAAEDVPGWQDFVRPYLTDTRQSPGVDGCGGLIIGSNAQILLGQYPLVPLKGVIVPNPGSRPRPEGSSGCTPER